MTTKEVEEAVARYTEGGELTAFGGEMSVAGTADGQPEFQVTTDAVTDNPDGTVTVRMMLKNISASASTPIRTPYGKTNEFWTNIGIVPDGDWRVTFRLESREVAESFDGLVEVGRELVARIADQHRLIVLSDLDAPLERPNVKLSR